MTPDRERKKVVFCLVRTCFVWDKPRARVPGLATRVPARSRNSRAFDSDLHRLRPESRQMDTTGNVNAAKVGRQGRRQVSV